MAREWRFTQIKLSKELRGAEVESKTPEIAAKNQSVVISFAKEQIEEMAKKYDKIILLEGRAFTLDFLPSDLRIRLSADPVIRAERRWGQSFNK